MKTFLRGLLVAMAALCALAQPALAQNLTIKDGNGTSQTLCTTVNVGVNTPCSGIASGADVTEGTTGDAAYTGSGSATIDAILKGLYAASTGPIPGGPNVIGKVGIDQTTPGVSNGVQAIPTCTKVVAINQTASTDVYTSTAKVHLCSLVLFTQAAAAVSVVEGTGTTCGTGTTALIGAATATWGATSGAGTGLQFFAGQGISQTSGVPFLQSQTTADHICILQAAQSGTSVVSGFLSFSDN